LIDRPQVNDLHPTMKPVGLVERSQPRNGGPTPPRATVRCAIYTRKSTEEGWNRSSTRSWPSGKPRKPTSSASGSKAGRRLRNDMTTEVSAAATWTGRPSSACLEDIAARRIDCVVVYKVDRLSRSLLDFASIIGILDRHNATFVSVTQQFNTNTSLRRLTLNILLSFAQFEREIISERTRDKVFAARRKGKWTGGHPTLGYDIEEKGGKLRVNHKEAGQVREIFRIFTRTRSLIETLYAIEQRGWRTKSWITRSGTPYGGNPFTRYTLAYLLSNPIYLGQVRPGGANKQLRALS
jgi:site-specific DNA recombinase